jgi:hypothetical protein
VRSGFTDLACVNEVSARSETSQSVAQVARRLRWVLYFMNINKEKMSLMTGSLRDDCHPQW